MSRSIAVALALLVAVMGGCRREDAAGRAEGQAAPPAPAPPATKAPGPPAGSGAVGAGAQGDPGDRRCNPVARQTGPGCEMAGIMAAVQPLRQPGKAIPLCFRAHVLPPVAGRMMVQFSLSPDGFARDFQWLKDEFDSPSLRECLRAALAEVAYPAPGDVPCTVRYPFTFTVGESK